MNICHHKQINLQSVKVIFKTKRKVVHRAIVQLIPILLDQRLGTIQI